MAVAEVLSTVVGLDRLSTMEDRFQWCLAWKREGNGEFTKAQVVDKLGRKELANKPFEYLHDQATGELYIAHHPNVLSVCFFCAVVATPFMAIATLCWSVAKFAVTIIQVLYLTCNAVYLQRHEKNFVTVSLGSIEGNLQRGRQELYKPLCKAAEAFLYFVAMEVASINALAHFYNIEEMLKMWMVIDRIEKMWNHEADFRRTPFSVGVRMGKEIENGKALQEIYRDLRLSQIASACYMLQCFQSRGNITDMVSGPPVHKFTIRTRCSTYAELQEYIKEPAERV